MARPFRLALCVLALAVAPLRAEEPKSKPGDVHLALGNPSSASADSKNPDPIDYLVVKDEYALSYNSKKGTPNWVSYRLRKGDMGRAARSLTFFPDPDLPKQFYQVKPFDYHFNATGMTRGHMCPNSHRNNTEEAARETFCMTNMVPQTEELNAGSWNNLEIWCRDVCFRQNKELHIVCGPHGQGGKSEHGLIKTVGNGKVIVPKSCWKVIAMLDAGSTKSPAARVNAKTPLIAVVMPNDRTPTKEVSWEKYVVSVADVESLTGYRFFDRVPAEVIGPLKKKVYGAD
jgi:endonuclease G